MVAGAVTAVLQVLLLGDVKVALVLDAVVGRILRADAEVALAAAWEASRISRYGIVVHLQSSLAVRKATTPTKTVMSELFMELGCPTLRSTHVMRAATIQIEQQYATVSTTVSVDLFISVPR
jgi:hypothetical protein